MKPFLNKMPFITAWADGHISYICLVDNSS